MKKSFLLSALFVCAMCLGFTACGDDDDVDNGGKKQTAVDSRLYGTYDKSFDRESAYELLVEQQKQEERQMKPQK